MPDEVADVGDVLGKKGDEVNGNKDLPDDCHCYMQITMVENAPKGIEWQWYDFSDGVQKTNYFVHGMGSNWNNGYAWVPFPSISQELDLPSFGTHYFELRPFSEEPFPDNFRLHTKVQCYLETSGGAMILMNEYVAIYDFGQGDAPQDPNNPNGKSFIGSFSCQTTIGGGSE